MISNTNVIRLYSFKIPQIQMYIKDNILDDYTKGIELINQRNYKQALIYFEECIKIFENINQKNHHQYYYSKEKLALCLYKNENYTKCEKELEDMVVLSKKYHHSFINKANANHIAFLSFFNVHKAQERLKDILNQVVEEKVKGYFLTEFSVLNYLNKNGSKAIEISDKIIKCNKDKYLTLVNNHNIAVMKSSLSSLISTYELFTKENSIQYPYGLTIVELCKMLLSNKFKEKTDYFNKGLAYFNKKENKNDKSISTFLALLGEKYNKHNLLLYSEGLYQNAIEFASKLNKSPLDKYNLMIIKEMYSNFLLNQPNRNHEGKIIKEQCNKILDITPSWYGKLGSLYHFKLDLH